LQLNLDDTIPSFDGLGAAASGAGSKMKAAAEKAKTAWTGTAEALKSALSTLQTQHETEMIRAEMAGDKVASYGSSIASLMRNWRSRNR